VLANVSIGRGERRSGMQAYSDAQLAESTSKALAVALKHGRRIQESHLHDNHGLPVVNVVLTDTSAPLYLVLQNRQDDVLWNIHPAPGVQIAHMAVIGPGIAAVNPPPGDYDVEFLQSGSDCLPDVARQPAPFWRALKTHDKAEALAALNRLNDAYYAYDTWFRARFGQGSEDDVVGYDLTNHVLVGPMPDSAETRVPFRRLDRAEVLVTRTDNVFVSPKRRHRGLTAALHASLLTEAAGGDVDAIFPSPMTRADLNAEEAAQ